MVASLELRDFRNYEHAAVELAPGLTVIAGANGAGKTNLLEAVYFGCTARSPRTSNERELVRRGAPLTRIALVTRDADAEHRIEVGFDPREPKRLSVDGAPVDSLAMTTVRPLLSVFLPERLELVKGAPAARRAHLDQLVAALWPARAETRTAYSRALAQRNALLGRIRGGVAGPGCTGRLGRRARCPRHRTDGRSTRGGRRSRRALCRAGRAPGLAGRGRAALPAAGRPRPTSRVWWPSWPSDAAPTSSVASLPMGRTATSCSCCSRLLRCAPTGPRASSEPPCWRCCSPNASCWRCGALARR